MLLVSLSVFNIKMSLQRIMDTAFNSSSEMEFELPEGSKPTIDQTSHRSFHTLITVVIFAA